MTIYTCRFGRSRFRKAFKGIAVYGRHASRKETYSGVKFYTINTTDRYLTDYIITPTNIDDRVNLWNLIENKANLTLITDKGYTDEYHANPLFNERKITLIK